MVDVVFHHKFADSCSGEALGFTFFEFHNFLGRGSEVVEVSEDLAFQEFLSAFLDFLVGGEDTFSRLGWCLP